ncbi:MAG: LON peptidase substrate-binding domain-containing protein [Anaerolineae bacterium]|nr:LON peptidase substrate-binding domain-containing protein [Anaerolineae bacterium]
MTAEPLPLFPLNVVLFPGMVLPLHIFEDRYRLMIGRCLDESRPFGVLLIREGKEVGETAVPYEVGTTARITRVERLDDGRMNITTVGVERFRVRRFREGEPYLQGEIVPLPNLEGETPQAVYQAEVVRPLVSDYVGLLAKAAGLQLGLVDNLPEDPAALAFLTAIALQIPIHEKQELLATQSIASLLAEERGILRREDKLLRFMVDTGPRLSDMKLGPTGYLFPN